MRPFLLALLLACEPTPSDSEVPVDVGSDDTDTDTGDTADTGDTGDTGDTADTADTADTGDTALPVDADGDGVPEAEDCDDTAADIHPGAEEICDGNDNDCDGQTDEGVGSAWFRDDDGDGYGDPTIQQTACTIPAGYVADGTDCDDADAAFHPGADETCLDTLDYNCDGSVGYTDVDADGWAACLECDDSRADINPDAPEVCDGADNDCDTLTDDADDSVDLSTGSTFYNDVDKDTFGDPDLGVTTCSAPLGHVSDATDCDDSTAAIHPDATEVCNEADDDCDGLTDDADDSLDLTTASTWYGDGDRDGYGDDADTLAACDLPTGYTNTGGDCDDADDRYNPGASESCDDPNDYNCDGYVGYADADADGHAACVDCDDGAADVHPGATEVCNDVDDDCDGAIDDDDASVDLSTGSTGYADADLDGWGDPAAELTACDLPSTYLADATDCDDTVGTVNPAATEVCNDVDDDCDGAIDDDDASTDLSTAGTFYADDDGDDFGDPGESVVACDSPADWVTDATDCDDGNRKIHPLSVEICNGIDDDCDDLVDDEDDDADVAGGGETFYADVDGDGFGDAATATDLCDAPEGWVTNGRDCDDAEADVNPAATEVCNDIDDDCDGAADDDDADLDSTTATVWYFDSDSDDFGDPFDTLTACDAPPGYIALAEDCDDTRGDVNPDATEICNGIDDDCDDDIDDDDAGVDLSTGDTFYADADGDTYGNVASTIAACDTPVGYVSDTTDCDDKNGDVNPAASEVCNDIDDDCDGDIDDADATVDVSTGTDWYRDSDADTWGDASDSLRTCDAPSGYVADAEDCDDGDEDVNPDATEVCNGIDDDCDTDVDDADADVDLSTGSTWYYDGDADGYGSSATTVTCDAPPSYVSNADDCDDAVAGVNPDADEFCDDVDNDCDGDIDDADASLDLGSATTWYDDDDGDGYGDATDTTLACDQPSGYDADDDDCDDADSSVYPGATETCDGDDEDCDGSIDDGMNTITYSSSSTGSSSCNGRYNYQVTFSACGCSDVTLTGSFTDGSDGSGGQVVGASVTASSGMSLTWDDCPSGCDCDLDIAASTSWSVSKSSGVMSVSVTNSITGYDAGNTIYAGYSISNYGTYRDRTGTSSNTFTYTCSY